MAPFLYPPPNLPSLLPLQGMGGEERKEGMTGEGNVGMEEGEMEGDSGVSEF